MKAESIPGNPLSRQYLKTATAAFQLLAAGSGCRRTALRTVLDLVMLRMATARGLVNRDIAAPDSDAALARVLRTLPEADNDYPGSLPLAKARQCLDQIPDSGLTLRLAGDLYQELLEAPANDDREQRKSLRKQRQKQGTFFTPEPIITEILNLAFAEANPALTVCDPAMGSGHFLLAITEKVLAAHGLRAARDFASRNLFGMDLDVRAVSLARRALWLLLSRPGDLFTVPQDNFRAMNSLLDPLPWTRISKAGGFDVIVGNPPYDVLTNFARNPEAKEYASRLRASVHLRLSLKGQINLYRCFIEQSLAMLKPGGLLSLVVPASLLMDRVAGPLRRELLLHNAMDRVHVFDESDRVFTGVQQAVTVFRACRDKGAAKTISVNDCNITLDSLWSMGEELPLPRAGEQDWELVHWLAEHAPRKFSTIARGAVGEVDQTVFARHMRKNNTNTLLLRGCHVRPFCADLDARSSRRRFLDLKGFLEQKGNAAAGCRENAGRERVAQLGIRNLQSRPRLIAVRVKPGVYLGNSLNYWLPRGSASCSLLLGLLNSRLFDWRFRLTSSNNNINVCEVNDLPLPQELDREKVRKVEAAAVACEAVADDEARLAEARRILDDTVFELFSLLPRMREYLLVDD